jgi:4-hydroxy-tetrahydrodipicolinate reductase
MRVIINGIGGKVGTILYHVMSGIKDAVVVAGVDKFAVNSDYNVPVYLSIDECREEADVIIDFSRPEALYSVIPYALKKKVGVVLATTGYTTEDKA